VIVQGRVVACVAVSCMAIKGMAWCVCEQLINFGKAKVLLLFPAQVYRDLLLGPDSRGWEL